MPIDSAIRIGISLTQSLEVLHRAGLIHRDIKPSNVIFIRREPKLADVGLVAEASEAKSIVGTNGFIAPEGPTSARADIFSLGKLLYEIATGMDRLEFPQLPKQATGSDNLLQEFNDIIPAKLPADVKVAHKTGWIRGLNHDSGIVILPDGRKYVLVILSDSVEDEKASKENMATASKMIYDYVNQ